MNPITFTGYQDAAMSTAVYPRSGLSGVYYTALGLANEAGEVAGKVKKMMRDDDLVLSDARKEQIAAEIGDVLWYCAALAHELGIHLGDIAAANIDKLADRSARNALKGDGDTR